MDYQHILLAVDLTLDSQASIQKACTLALKFDTVLSIVHVVESLPGYASGYVGTFDIEEEIKNEAKTKLLALGEKLNVPEANQHLSLGSPKIMILDVAEKINADLIVLGSHGRHGLSRLLGSTASAVLHGDNCDVLVVHHGETS